MIKVLKGNEYLHVKKRTNEAPSHRVEELLNDNLLNRYREDIFSHSAKARRLTATRNTRFLKHHQKYLEELKNGTTNEYIENICFNGYCNRVEKETIVEQILQDFQTRYIINDHDTTPKRIRERVLSHYRRLGRANILIENRRRKAKKEREKLFNELYPIIKKVVETIGKEFWGDESKQEKRYITRKRRSLKSYLYELLKWKQYIQSLTYDEAMMMETQYQYFFNRVKRKKLIPVPKIILEKWYSRYWIIMPILIKYNFISVNIKYYNPYIEKQYDKSLIGHCNYIQINF